MNDVTQYVVYSYSGRGIATTFTNNLMEIYDKSQKGWKYEIVNGNFWLRAPEIWLVNIVDPQKVLYYGNSTLNFSYYIFLQKLIKTNSLYEYIESVVKRKWIFYKNFSFAISTGAVQEAEVRVIGSDTRIYNLKNDLFQSFFFGDSFKDYYAEAKVWVSPISPLRLCKYEPYELLSDSLKTYYERIEQIFNTIGCREIYNPIIINGLKEQIIECEYFVFVPTSCFGYISSFISEDKIEKTSFIEMHSNVNLKRQLYFDLKDFSGKKVLVIDKCYSGKTLKKVKKKVEDAGGRVITLGLFPNNHYVASELDYVLILNRIYDMSLEKTSDDWLVKKYIEGISMLEEEKDIS